MLKDCADNNTRRRIKSPTPDGLAAVKSPKKRRQRVPPQHQEVPRQQAARYMSSLRNPRAAALSFPDEYQAPQALGLQLHKTSQIQHIQVLLGFTGPKFRFCVDSPPQPQNTSMQSSMNANRPAPSVESRQRAVVSPVKELKRELPPPDLALLSIDDEDEELPPPPPTLMHTSVVHHLPSPPPSAIQLVPSDAQAVVCHFFTVLFLFHLFLKLL
ncbi:unnamed protein product [Cylicostephanus goldi]|uniref:Uncharacterized protein n=1 Tax=Cylicostephanus goldi TaxID=71465 RepID=A0A3P6TTU9_CYLGO|nr:unnamed protein product [Cylicostephanus goldi]